MHVAIFNKVDATECEKQNSSESVGAFRKAPVSYGIM
jgi:hypothetical protein